MCTSEALDSVLAIGCSDGQLYKFAKVVCAGESASTVVEPQVLDRFLLHAMNKLGLPDTQEDSAVAEAQSAEHHGKKRRRVKSKAKAKSKSHVAGAATTTRINDPALAFLLEVVPLTGMYRIELLGSCAAQRRQRRRRFQKSNIGDNGRLLLKTTRQKRANARARARA